jgi:hypothetical protein
MEADMTEEYTVPANPTLPLSARREQESINPLSGERHYGKWVVRDARGFWIDADTYRNDLNARYDNLIILGG